MVLEGSKDSDRSIISLLLRFHRDLESHLDLCEIKRFIQELKKVEWVRCYFDRLFESVKSLRRNY